MLTDPFSDFPIGAQHKLDMEQGDILFRQGQLTSGLYRVISGCVSLRRIGLEGDYLTLHSASAGGYFAEASVFSNTYHCDAVCTQSGQVEKFGKDAVVSLMQTDQTFSSGLIRLLATQVQSYRAHIELLAIKTAKDRVFAAMQAGYFDASVKDLAARINLTHEACYRALRTLCDERKLDRIAWGKYTMRSNQN